MLTESDVERIYKQWLPWLETPAAKKLERYIRNVINEGGNDGEAKSETRGTAQGAQD